MNRFILNADDLGKTEFNNIAVAMGFEQGILQSASIMPNMPFFKDALTNVVKKYPNNSIGVHLNLIEGKSISQGLDLLTDKDDNFNNGYLALWLKSYNDKFLKQVEIEFRAQIEAVLEHFRPTHLDSHVHTHGIPNIFNVVLKLAREYEITQIRTQYEMPYTIRSKEYDFKKYLINRLKVYLLNHFTKINMASVKRAKITTNDFILGVGYTSMMNSRAILEGLRQIRNTARSGLTVEALIHPCIYFDETKDSHTVEFEITQDEKFLEDVQKLGFYISNYKN